MENGIVIYKDFGSCFSEDYLCQSFDALGYKIISRRPNGDGKVIYEPLEKDKRENLIPFPKSFQIVLKKDYSPGVTRVTFIGGNEKKTELERLSHKLEEIVLAQNSKPALTGQN